MRPLEILIPFLLAFYILYPLFSRNRSTPIRFLPAITLIVMFAQIGLEGSRWQMIPIYVITIITFLHSAATFTQTESSALNGWMIAGIALAIVVIGVSTAVPALLPVPQVPAPTGKYKVGTTYFELTDPSRKEIYSSKDEPRRIVVQIWYPADPNPDSEIAPWMPHAESIAPAIAVDFELPAFFLNHLTLSQSNAYLDAPVHRGEAPYPIILFSHGWKGFRAQNTFQMQELASHGYIAVAVDHTYGAVMTVFPDGTLAPYNPSALPGDNIPIDEYEKTARILVDQWTGDLSFILTTLEQMSLETFDMFNSAIDFKQVGAMGHSTGGGAAIQFCATDPRCDAAFLMDPFMRPVSKDVLDRGLTHPAFFMFSQVWSDDVESRNNALFNRFYPHVTQPAPVIDILGTSHYDFSDLPALSPLAPQLGLKGPINGARVQRIINDYTLAFFDLHFKGIATSLLDGARPDYPELRWEKR